MSVNAEYLRKYVELIVRVGANVQRGQDVVVSCPVECAYFARLAVEEAYKAGAKEVHLNWVDDACARAKYLYAPDEAFDNVAEWRKVMYNGLSEKGNLAMISVSAADPEALKGVNLARVQKWTKVSSEQLSPYRERMMKNEFAWSVVSVPSSAWAKKVFEDAPDDETAKDRLWEAIFKASRVDGGDAVQNWKEHVAALTRRVKALNEAAFKVLKYKNSIGTDLTVELPENHVWLGGGENTRGGLPFLANIPTEEVFTAPKKTGVDGKLAASLPFVYNGNVVEGFALTFKGGKVTDFSAKNDGDKKFVEALLTSVPNMEYLGEVALVPYSSPISAMGRLFYNTLYDENAACHFALGQAYADCVKGGGDMSKDEREAAGLNSSPDHEDFMIGTADLSIVGVDKNGIERNVFVNGDFAPDFD